MARQSLPQIMTKLDRAFWTIYLALAWWATSGFAAL